MAKVLIECMVETRDELKILAAKKHKPMYVVLDELVRGKKR